MPYPLLPVVGGTLDGTEHAYHPRHWMLRILDVTIEQYELVLDDTGARYWRLRGYVPLATIAA